MADVDDRWHSPRPGTDGPTPCREHAGTRGDRPVYPTEQHGCGKRWQARWRDPAGSQRKRNFAKKSDAEQFLSDVAADVARGTYVDRRAGRITLADYATTKWLPVLVHLRPNSVDLYAAHLRNHIVPVLGSRQVGAIGRAEVKAFVSGLAGRLAPATVHTVYAVLRALMSAAMDDQVIGVNPCSRVPLPAAGHRVIVSLPAASVLALAGAITPRYEVTVWLAAGAGLREGEVLGLTVPRVEFLARRLLVEEQVQRGELSPLKTRASKRVVPLDKVVLDKVAAHLARWPARDPLRLVVTNRCGRVVRRSSFGHCWRDAVAGAGLPAGTRFHDLRHFYASTLIAANTHPKVIQSRLGHATIAETMDTYGHLFPDAEDTGRGVLDAVLAPSDVPSMCPQVAQ